jgi:signal transduction histidine kinase
VAHEINNPLAGLLIYADMLMKEIKHNEQWRRDLEEIINQTLRCKQIVSRLLEFSRQSLEERVVFDVSEVIGHCAELLRHQALFHNVEIIQDLQPGLPQILGNPGELEQVFTNLIINAADAMNGRGRLTISGRLDVKAEQVILNFADTGPGIPPAIKDKIFEPFFTTKPVGVGTGLGLSVVYGVVQRHRGTIEVESPPGGGATFLIRLPLGSSYFASYIIEPITQMESINKLVDGMLRLVEKEASLKHINIVRNFQESLPLVGTDPPWLRKVILAFLCNATAVVQEHGTVSITTRIAGDNTVAILVSDTGAGIAEEDLEKIFDPSFATTLPGKSAGLDLSICDSIIQKLGGSLLVTSEVGKGTTFIIRLPMKRSRGEP